LLQTTRNTDGRPIDPTRAGGRQRLTAFVLALLVETVLLLAVLSLGWAEEEPKKPGSNLVSIAVEAPPEQPEPAKPDPARASPPLQKPKVQPPQLAQPVEPKPAPLAAAIIPLSRGQMAAVDITNLPRSPAPPAPGKAPMGPPDLGVPGDSKRVGSAPNGQPMYAAAWYREPYDDELSGYLSTAEGPGWGLIACRTAPDFRVEDCVGLGEYPTGSRIERAVLAAAWQFRVRPPRVGGVSRVGDWVRIRIDYGIRRK
jgi:periplasmic protein TonB